MEQKCSSTPLPYPFSQNTTQSQSSFNPNPLTVRQKFGLMCGEPLVDAFGVERLCQRNVNFYSNLLCANADDMMVCMLL